MKVKAQDLNKIILLHRDYQFSSRNFQHWFKSLGPTDEIIIENHHNVLLLRDPTPPHFCSVLLYKDFDSLKNLKPLMKTYFLLTEEHSLDFFETFKTIYLSKDATTKTETQNVLIQDDPTGWEEILQRTIPSDKYSYVLKNIHKAIEAKSFYCKRDSLNQISSLVIWSIENKEYQGHFWWSKDSTQESIKALLTSLTFAQNNGASSFKSTCIVDNKGAYAIQKMLGFNDRDKPFYLYESFTN